VSHYFFSVGLVLVAGFRAGALRVADFFAAAALGFAAALGVAAGFGFASACGSSFFAALERVAPIAWISISESMAREPVWR
jgi:hypothetical protein